MRRSARSAQVASTARRSRRPSVRPSRSRRRRRILRPPPRAWPSPFPAIPLLPCRGRLLFRMAGNIGSGHFFRAGSFVADGAGNLNSVLEDTDTASGATSTPISTTGSYTVGADGRGTLQFNDGLSPASFDFVLVNGSQLADHWIRRHREPRRVRPMRRMLRRSPARRYSALNGTYVFDFAGVDGSNGLSQIGEFNADGAGNITSGSIDINDGGSPELISNLRKQDRVRSARPLPLFHFHYR